MQTHDVSDSTTITNQHESTASKQHPSANHPKDPCDTSGTSPTPETGTPPAATSVGRPEPTSPKPAKLFIKKQFETLPAQDVGAFLAKTFPPKTPLIADVLYRRDRISLTGRRRHGKTTEMLNIAVAGACGIRSISAFQFHAHFRLWLSF